MARHDQTWVTVNVPVDKGVDPPVKALSAVPGLETVESCEGGFRDGPLRGSDGLDFGFLPM
jgi:hypothetical protein